MDVSKRGMHLRYFPSSDEMHTQNGKTPGLALWPVVKMVSYNEWHQRG